MVLLLLTREVNLLGREDVTSAGIDLTLALTATTLTAASRGEEDILVSEGRKQRLSGFSLDNGVGVDGNLYFARVDKIFLSEQKDQHQHKSDDEKDAHA